MCKNFVEMFTKIDIISFTKCGKILFVIFLLLLQLDEVQLQLNSKPVAGLERRTMR